MITLHPGDCLPILKSMGDESFDACITDPPYGIDYQSNMRTVSEKFDVLENDNNDSRLEAYPEIYRVLKMNTVMVAFCSFKNFAVDYVAISKLFDIKNVLVWEKGGGGIGDLVNSLSTDYELAIVGHKGACPIRGRRDGSVWRSAKVNANTMLHPTEKPLSLIKRIVMKWTDVGAIVLDPYMGSGTTGVACIETDRHFVGVELKPQYFAVSKSRIEAAQLQKKLQPEFLALVARGVDDVA